ncbi:MAG TPA: hypothetical protein VG347_10125 [Verrucomicrobiae bacterium]|nr:hypothetical protein [Verrucomicrobiae bacterium]
MNTLAAAEKGLIKAMILAIGMASVARAGIPYLPLTGPPALRVLAVKSTKTVPAMKTEISTNLAKGDTNCPDIQPFNTNTTETVVGWAGGSGPNLGGPLPSLNMGPGSPLDGVSPFAMAPQNTVNMTPQMLATYFQPLVIDTNGAAVTAPFRVGFIPPFAEPDKSSHSQYIIK